MITNLNELKNYIGLGTPYTIGRSLYKHTPCGVWTSFIVLKEKEKTENYVLQIGCDPITGNAKLEKGIATKDDLRTLALDGTEKKFTWQEYVKLLDEFCEKDTNVYKVHKKSIARRWVHIKRSVPAKYENIGYQNQNVDSDVTNENCAGLVIGSIVEGSDVEIEGRELWFPFELKELDELLNQINDEATFYWKRDNDPNSEIPEDAIY